MKSLEIKKNIYWIGVLDPNLKIFDIIMETKFGTSYNSYLVKGSEKIAVFETTKAKFFDDYLNELEEVLPNPTEIDYIVVDHTEPDHSGSLVRLLDYAKNATVVGSKAAIEFLKNIVNKSFKYKIVEHGDTISLGDKTLKFISAPFLHWPDSIYTYIEEDKVLITCDSFGAHYAFNEILLSKLPEEKKQEYMVALRYYFMCIFSPFKKYMLQGIDKIKDLQIDMVLPGHGPILDKNPQDIIKIYKDWSTEENPNKYKVIVMPYVSAYGYTGEIADEIEKGIKFYDSSIVVKKYNLNVDNFKTLEGEILREFKWADGILFGTSTINGDALPPIWSLVTSLNPIVDAGKYASAFGSYGWSGEGVPNIIDRLNQLRMHVIDGYVIKFKPDENDLRGAFEFGKKFADAMTSKKIVETKAKNIVEVDMNPSKEMKNWRCTVCGEVYAGIEPPKVCPACGVGREYFVEVEEKKDIKVTPKKEKIVIVGAGAAGVSAAEAARIRNPLATIEIIGREKEYPYYRTMLSEMISEKISEDRFLIKPEKWYDENNIDLRLGTAVNNINLDEKFIQILTGEKVYYDKLILANGSRAMVPDIGNANIAGVFTLREKSDLDILMKYIVGKKKAVVIGGGVLGLETAWGLKQIGMDVEVIEMMQRILPRQLDEEGSALFEKNIAKSDIKVHQNSRVSSLQGSKKVEKVILDNGIAIDTDIVIISSGIVPNIELITNKGVKTNRGIMVNEKMETSAQDIYACGDIAEYHGVVMGLWQVALAQGEVAGANAAGDKMTYIPQMQPVTYEGMGTKILSAGSIVPTSETLSEIDYDNLNYKKMYFKEDILSAGILIGDISKGVQIIKGIRENIEKNNLLKKIYD